MAINKSFSVVFFRKHLLSTIHWFISRHS